MDGTELRSDLERKRVRAHRHVYRGIRLLVAAIPVMVIGGLLVALLNGTAEHVAVGVMSVISMSCFVVGVLLMLAGLRQDERARKELHALDHGPPPAQSTLPKAQVIRKSDQTARSRRETAGSRSGR